MSGPISAALELAGTLNTAPDFYYEQREANRVKREAQTRLTPEERARIAEELAKAKAKLCHDILQTTPGSWRSVRLWWNDCKAPDQTASKQ